MKVTKDQLVKILSDLRSDNQFQLLITLKNIGDPESLNNSLAITQKHNAQKLEIRAYDSFEAKDQLKVLGFRFGDDFNGCYWGAFSHWSFNESALPEGPSYKIF